MHVPRKKDQLANLSGPYLPLFYNKYFICYFNRIYWESLNLYAGRRLDIRASESMPTFGPETCSVWPAVVLLFFKNWTWTDRTVWFPEVPTVCSSSWTRLTGSSYISNSREAEAGNPLTRYHTRKLQIFKILANMIYLIKSKFTGSSTT